MFTKRYVAAAVGLLLSFGSGAYSTAAPAMGTEPAGPSADLLIVNAKIWTGVDIGEGKTGHPDGPTALAVVGDKIVAVGNEASLRARIGPTTKLIDAEGRRVIPGITDSHTHMVSGGFQLSRLMLRDVRGRKEFVRAVAAEASTKKKGQWVLGGRWSVDSWPDQAPPNKGWLDPVTGDVPVFLSRMDGHSAFVNSAALRLAGIDASGPPDPKGGEIERDPNTREPTGILKESAMDLVSRLIPDPTPDERYEALRRAMRHANSLGVTSVHDMSPLADLEAFRRAEQEGTLTVRITVYLSVSDWAAYADRVAGRAEPALRLNSDMVRLAGFKGFMDGSLGSRTAYMREPYSDATPDVPYPRGQLTAMADPPESFQQQVALADARGLQLAVHAIGDEAIHLLLDAYEAAPSRGLQPARSPQHPEEHGSKEAAHGQTSLPMPPVRHRVEHTQHLHVEDIPRFARLGVVASMQPFHKADDGRYAEKALGRERLKGSYAFRQLVDAGALVIFGSDWPVVTMNPFMGIDSAVNAKTLAGEVWLPSHSLTLPEALYAYTATPPRAVHREDHLGTIEVGKYADIVILLEDPFTIPNDRVGEVKIAQTIVGGKVVYTHAD